MSKSTNGRSAATIAIREARKAKHAEQESARRRMTHPTHSGDTWMAWSNRDAVNRVRDGRSIYTYPDYSNEY